MPVIPPASDTDAEDVVWGLQTAASLWKRGERIDAVVWLRRAAQAAMDADAPSRAVELGRVAADLSDWLAKGAPEEEPAPAAPAAPAAAESSSIDVNVDDSLPAETAREPQLPEPPPPDAPSVETAPSRPMHATQPMLDRPVEDAAAPSTSPSVPPAEQVHAGMFNPWDDRPSAVEPPAAAPPAPPPPPPVREASSAPRVPAAPAATRPPQAPVPSVPPRMSGSPPRAPSVPAVAIASGSTDDDSDDEVLTSAGPASMSGAALAVPAAPTRIGVAPAPSAAPPPGTPSRAPGKPPPLPPKRPKPPIPAPRPSDADVETSAPRMPAAAPVEPEELGDDALLESEAPRAAHPDGPTVESAQLAPAPLPKVELEPAPAPAPSPEPGLDLEDVESFSDLPDDARVAFAAAAKIDRLAEGEEVSHFALAYVVEGEVDVAATVVDAPAMRLRKGAVLRSRGTTNEAVPMRLVATGAGATVATWGDDEVAAAFNSCPWVEDDLRAAADRMLTLVGITIGPLGERLDASIREAIVARLTIRTLEPGEVVVNAGETVPGLLLVGIGELELAKAEGVSAIVGSGEFLFPTEVLGAGSAPYTARAGAGGALVMFGDRHVAQELLVTCPPLLEVFAGM